MASSSTTHSTDSSFGHVLRAWRRKRGLSQLDLALASQVSQRHISFLESGRSHPSRDMVLRLATVLDVPLREQNVMLVAAGYAQVYKARELVDPDMQQIRRALEYILQQQEPYPAMVVDRHWHMCMGNAASGRLLAWLVGQQEIEKFRNAEGRLSLLRLLFHPAGMRPYIQNWHEVAGHLIERLHREAVMDGHNTTIALLNELLSYPEVPGNWQVPHWEAWQAPVLTVVLAKGDLTLRFFSTITTLGTPHDITLQELRVECFFPADAATERDITALSQH